jgi:antitoxin VapB
MITKIFKSGNSMAVRLPKELEAKEGDVMIERIGDRMVIEPCKSDHWPEGFFKSIYISDPSFQRPPQGESREIAL